MENYLHYNRAPPLEPLRDQTLSYPYQRAGNMTTVAKMQALPPTGSPGILGGSPVHAGSPPIYGPNGGPGPYPYFSPIVDHDRRMMRTNMIAQKH